MTAANETAPATSDAVSPPAGAGPTWPGAGASGRWIVGDAIDGIRRLAAEGVTVDLVLTSPPFLGLRSYIPGSDPREIGRETSPAEFVTRILDVVAAAADILAPTGTIAVELGDTYSGSGGAGGDYDTDGLFAGRPHWKQRRGDDPDAWPLPKSLAMVPELVRVALAYGVHPLTGEPSPAGRWRVRNVVRWVRPNPVPRALGDKFKPATSDMLIATRAADRWWDDIPVRDPATGTAMTDAMIVAPEGHRDHPAAWPPKLIAPIVVAACPRHVCRICGTPSRRIVERVRRDRRTGEPVTVDMNSRCGDPTGRYSTGFDVEVERRTVGWSTCEHSDDLADPDVWRPGIVLDPFAGSGTTVAVAVGNARAGVGIDLDPRNEAHAADRLGMFLVDTVRLDP